MLIGELAEALGVSSKTLRHYETVGLLPPASRTTAGYRVFGAKAVARARLIVGLRGLGLPVEAIRELLAPAAEGTLRQRLLARLDRDIQELAVEISVLQGRHDDLEARYRALLAADGGCVCAATLQPCTCAETSYETSA